MTSQKWLSLLNKDWPSRMFLRHVEMSKQQCRLGVKYVVTAMPPRGGWGGLHVRHRVPRGLARWPVAGRVSLWQSAPAAPRRPSVPHVRRTSPRWGVRAWGQRLSGQERLWRSRLGMTTSQGLRDPLRPQQKTQVVWKWKSGKSFKTLS